MWVIQKILSTFAWIPTAMTADIRKNNCDTPFGAYFSGPSKTSFLKENWGVRMFSSGNIDKAFGSTSYNNASYVGYIQETPPLIHYTQQDSTSNHGYSQNPSLFLFFLLYIMWTHQVKNRVFATLWCFPVYTTSHNCTGRGGEIPHVERNVRCA